MPLHPRREEIGNAIQQSLELLETLSKAVPVPYVEALAGTARKVADLIRGAENNKKACYDLADRIVRLVNAAISELQDEDARLAPGMEARVAALNESLLHLHGKMQAIAKTTLFRRVVNKSADADMIKDALDEVNYAMHLFGVKAEIAIGLDVKFLRDDATRKRVLEGADFGGWRGDRRCLSGTRTRYIDRIVSWSHNTSAPQVCYLQGVAGAGKSSLLHEIAALAHEEDHAYSCFFFKRDDSAMASSVVQLLAFGLSFIPGMHTFVTHAIEQMHDTRVFLTLDKQFDAFVAQPLLKFSATHPAEDVLLIIDAVDECPPEIRADFLKAIRIGISQLPLNVKILLTSRPQHDINSAIKSLCPLWMYIDVHPGSDDGDVERFLGHELRRIREVRGIEDTWSDEEVDNDAAALAVKSCGLFQWARVTCTLLLNRFRPRDIIDRILKLDDAYRSETNLDALYSEALLIVLPEMAEDQELRLIYLHVIGAVLSAKEPLGVVALSALCNTADESEAAALLDVRRFLVDLGCVITVEHGSKEIVRIAHPSFFDYITNPSRCMSPFLVDYSMASCTLGSQCLTLMCRRLKYNICDTGYPSPPVDRLAGSVLLRVIPDALRYSCNFGLMHVLEGIPGQSRLAEELDIFLFAKLLEWVEVMSLLGSLDRAIDVLRRLRQKETEVPNQDAPRSRLLYDAIRFLGQFGSAVSTNSLDVYLCALPFTPQNTLLYRTFAPRYSQFIPHVTVGNMEEWPEDLFTLQFDEIKVLRHLSFSNDGTRLSWLADGVAYMVSASTGARIWSLPYSTPVQAFQCGTTQIVLLHGRHSLVVADLVSRASQTLSHDSYRSSSSIEITSFSLAPSEQHIYVGLRSGEIIMWSKSKSSAEWRRASCFLGRHASGVLAVHSSALLVASVSQADLRIGRPDIDSCKWEIHGLSLTSQMAFAANTDRRWTLAIVQMDERSLKQRFAVYHTSASGAYHCIVIPIPNRKAVRHNPISTITPDTETLVAVERDNMCRTWNARTGTLLTEVALSGAPFSRLFSSISLPAVSPNGLLLAAASGSALEVRELKHNAGNSKVKAEKRPTFRIVTLASTSSGKLYAGEYDGTIHLCNAPRFKTSEAIGRAEDTIVKLAVSPDDTKVAALLKSSILLLLDLRAEKCSEWNSSWGQWKLGDTTVSGPVFSASSDLVAIAFKRKCDAQIRIGVYRLSTKEQQWACPELGNKFFDPLCLVFSGDETLVLLEAHRMWRVTLHDFRCYETRNPWSTGLPVSAATAYFTADLKALIQLCIHRDHRIGSSHISTTLTRWNLEDGRAVNIDPTGDPSAMNPSRPSDTLLQCPDEGWVYSVAGKPIFRIPPAFRGNTFRGLYCGRTSAGGRLALVRGTSLMVIDCSHML
ncbi:hypothetical protein FA95DRAFT_375989 [Auriscalpium vulgare]|uniref:Uncharacterized protein n=1 Tax=Auriscalpium vulgare TaxID=40419 RepID=A0ACB8RIM7_9AGAM|nr:hypothetical protein FA95DRAFT_375989 [Auriscalpium vulgare]